MIHQKPFSSLPLDGTEAQGSATVEALNLSWRVQLWQRLAGQIVERRRQLGQMHGRGWRWRHAWARMTRAAATLLLLGGMLLPQAAPVYASSGPAFVQRSGTANPFDGVNVGSNGTVTFADLDADGDLDAICGAGDGTIRYYQNTGSARVARFTQQTGAANPFDGLTVGSNSTPALVDIDADGDLDLFSGMGAGTIAYYQNTGTPRAPQFTQQTGAANPFNTVVVETCTAPAFVDIDADGDQDVFVGNSGRGVRYYQNTGTPRTPQFSEQTGSANPLDTMYVGSINLYSYPTFVDIDGDGDQDVFMGSKASTMAYFQNTGTRLAPVFTPRTGSANPLNWTSPDFSNRPGFVDIDADGDQDLFVGMQGGSILYYQNNGAEVLPVRAFTQRSGAANSFDGVDVGLDGMPALVDIDADGDLDAFIGADTGTISYYKNTGTAPAPVFTPQSGADNPFDGVDVGGFSAPSFVDVDADGDLDAFVGSGTGAVYYYKNTGTAQAPVFTRQSGADNPFNGVGGIANSAPAFADIDADGDLDAFIGNKSHLTGYSYYQNTGTAQAPVFTYYTGPDSPFSGVDLAQIVKPAFLDVDGDGDVDMLNGDGNGYLFYIKNTGTPDAPVFQRSYSDNPFDGLGYTGDAPAFADLDGDGDRDVVIGMFDGTLTYYQNTGSYYRDSGASRLVTPTFKPRSAANNPFNGVTVGGDSHPALGDLDGDADLDAVIGAADGTLRYYKNTGSVLAPVYVAQSGAANPFDGMDVGTASAPALADLDGDGDPDAVIGAADGTLRYYKNTGSALLPTFTALSGAANPFNGINVGDRSAPTFVDLDGDGDPDVFVGASNGMLSYYRNTGTALAPVFSLVNGNGAPFNGVDAGQNSTLAFADVDRDGDPDALIGAADGTLRYYKNTGTAATPVFSAQSGADNPFNGVDLGDNTAPLFADIDSDGDVDVFSGDAAGNIHYFEQSHCSFATESDAALAVGDTVQFGTGNSALFVKINTLGSLTSLSATCTPNNHPHAISTGLRTGFYWTISPNAGASGFDLDLTLPYKTPGSDNLLCRYDAPGGTWGCAQTSRTASDVTLAHVTALSDWVAGSGTTPTAVGLQSLAAHSPSVPGAGGIGLLGLLAGLLTGWLRRKE